MIKSKLWALGLIFAGVLGSNTGSAAERVTYIAAEEVDWNYLPENREVMMGMKIMEPQAVFVTPGPQAIGAIYKKVVFRQYQDESFTALVERGAKWQHLGVLGLVLHAEVGDTLKVVFKNKASRPYSIHPHGVFYDKSNEGVDYNDATDASQRRDGKVAPGDVFTYRWGVPESAGPAKTDPSSIVWPYHSHVNEIKDTNSGLVGAIIVSAKGQAKADGTPKDVDREFVTLFTVMNENESWYLKDMIKALPEGASLNPDDDAFVESNLMHSINGYVYGNIPGLVAKKGERVRWYTLALGTEVDLHSPHWHGHTGVMNGRRLDTLALMPAESRTIDMTADNPGTWMFHCHVNDHLAAGMTALYRVE